MKSEEKPSTHIGCGDKAQSLGTFFDSVLLEHRKISPSSKERANAPAQQMKDFMDIVKLKKLMERALDHSLPPIRIIIRALDSSVLCGVAFVAQCN